ncbi:hypothetical protein [Aquimarina sp. MAR_2010_214]|uniref:hypothetical protein n=1 Tax=Aquimarina sp. MAR_2010_214 TaxID=1250026 RepID=UPI001E58ACF7|nr:hypothetical protein [Aquimarina sp. MAR_2010_214]
MQTSDEFSVATPADRNPGDDVIISPDGSCGIAEDRMEEQNEEMECGDWFSGLKNLIKTQC